MKNWYEAHREELRNRSDKGFTLMEMLIVVAIIAVLIAIAIPVFTTQLESSREATDKSNVRSAYGTLMAQFMLDSNSNTATVSAAQAQAGWQNGTSGAITEMVDGVEREVSYEAKTSGNHYTITINKSTTDSSYGHVTVS